MVKRPTKPFNAAVQNRDPDTEASRTDDLKKLRDKDNVGRAPTPPRFVPGGGATNLAPRGALGIRRDLPVPEPDKGHVDPRAEHPESKGWIHGRITSMEGYGFSVKLADMPAERNLGHGRIERVVVYRDQTPVANYDRGWKVKPGNARDQEAFTKIRDVFDPTDRDFKPIAPKTPDKDRGHDR